LLVILNGVGATLWGIGVKLRGASDFTFLLLSVLVSFSFLSKSVASTAKVSFITTDFYLEQSFSVNFSRKFETLQIPSKLSGHAVYARGGKVGEEGGSNLLYAIR